MESHLSPDEICRLRRQIDHYFCDFNLQSGHYLRKKLQDPGYITTEELMAFNKVSQLSKDSLSNVETILQSQEFDFVSFDPLSKRLTRRNDRPFEFVQKFWRTHAKLSAYLLCFPDEFDQSQIQQSIPGVAFVRLVTDIQKSVIADDDTLRDLEDSFMNLSCSDNGDRTSPMPATMPDRVDTEIKNKRKPYAILYFEDEVSMNALLNACGPQREFYFDNNNKKCYIRPRREERLEPTPQPHSPKTSPPSILQSAKSRTMTWVHEDFTSKSNYDHVKALFKPFGVAVCFLTHKNWMLYFKTTGEFRHFHSQYLDKPETLPGGVFIPLAELDTNDRWMKAYMKVLRNFYKK